ncbi:MAG: hypothetical protein LBR45_03140 [Bacteroidales bacterium]|jgi:hypothetical protein|nr:hypothetical protein [Bacteroidales bacterium]
MKKIFLLALVFVVMFSGLRAQETFSVDGEPMSQYSIKYVLKKDGNIVETKTLPILENEFVYPQILPFTEYSIPFYILPPSQPRDSCRWVNLTYPQEGELIIIDNNEELENYISCINDNTYPEIDFSKYTLLVASGGMTQGYSSVAKQLIQVAKYEYNLNIEIDLNMTADAPIWGLAILVSKIPEDITVSLNVSKCCNP